MNGKLKIPTLALLKKSQCENVALAPKKSEKPFNKLTFHLRFNASNQTYFHIGELLFPSVASSKSTLNQNTLLESFSKIPFLRALPQNELIDEYTHFHRLMLLSINRNEDPNVKDILWATKCCFSTFTEAALQSILSPTNSVAAKCFCSK